MKPIFHRLPLWVTTSIGIVTFILLALVGVRFKLPEITEPIKKLPEEVSNLTKQQVEMKILVLDEVNKNPIENVEVKLIVSNGSPATKKTDDNGYVSFTFPEGVRVRVFLSKEGFKRKNQTWNKTIDPNQINIYYLIQEQDIYSRKSCPKASPKSPFSEILQSSFIRDAIF